MAAWPTYQSEPEEEPSVPYHHRYPLTPELADLLEVEPPSQQQPTPYDSLEGKRKFLDSALVEQTATGAAILTDIEWKSSQLIPLPDKIRAALSLRDAHKARLKDSLREKQDCENRWHSYLDDLIQQDKQISELIVKRGNSEQKFREAQSSLHSATREYEKVSAKYAGFHFDAYTTYGKSSDLSQELKVDKRAHEKNRLILDRLQSEVIPGLPFNPKLIYLKQVFSQRDEADQGFRSLAPSTLDCDYFVGEELDSETRSTRINSLASSRIIAAAAASNQRRNIEEGNWKRAKLLRSQGWTEDRIQNLELCNPYLGKGAIRPGRVAVAGLLSKSVDNKEGSNSYLDPGLLAGLRGLEPVHGPEQRKEANLAVKAKLQQFLQENQTD